MHHGGAPTGKEEIGIPSLFTCAVLAVVAWFSVRRRTVDVGRTVVRGGGERPGVALYASFLAGLLLLVAGIFLGAVSVGLPRSLPRTVAVELGFVVVWVCWLYRVGRVARTAVRAVADLREGPERFVGHVVDRRQSTFLVTREQFARAREGTWVRVFVTTRLDHVADVELVTPPPSSSVVGDMTVTLRRRRSRARGARV